MRVVVVTKRERDYSRSVDTFLEDFATNSTIIWGEKTSLPYKGLQRGRQVVFYTSDWVAIKKNSMRVSPFFSTAGLFSTCTNWRSCG